MANITLRFVSTTGTLIKELSLPVRNENPIGFEALCDLLYSAGHNEFVRQLEAGQYKVGTQNPRDARFAGRVELKSQVEEGMGAGPVVAARLMSQGHGVADVNVPAGTTIEAAYRKANLQIPANATLLLDGRAVTKTTQIPANGQVQIAATGAVKGGC